MFNQLSSEFFSYQPNQTISQAEEFIPMPLFMLYFCYESPIADNNIQYCSFTDDKEEVQSAATIREKDSESQEKELENILEKRAKKALTKNVFKKNIKNKGKETSKIVNKKTPKSQMQNAFRNILPNIIHQIFCFIQKPKRSGQIVEKYLSSSLISIDQKFDVDRFYHYQRLIKDKTNHYINMKGLKELNKFQEPSCEIYSQTEQQNFLRMNRILLKYFLEHEFESIVCTSVRMKAETRMWHFDLKRKILDELSENLNQF